MTELLTAFPLVSDLLAVGSLVSVMQESSKDLAGLVVPQAGRLVGTDDPWEPYRLVDADGVVVAPVAAYLRDLQAAGRSAATARSYGKEWTEFLGHFERRKVSTGTCGRAFGAPCIHEHACIRCSMLWPDPTQRDRLIEIRDNLTARIDEAEREGWLGEVEGLQISLAGAEDKLAQIERRSPNQGTVNLGIPILTRRP